MSKRQIGPRKHGPKATGERHLYRRRGRFFVRLTVPEKLRERLREHVEEHLHTADLRVAKRLAPASIARLRDHIERARQGGPPTGPELDYERIAELRRWYDKMVQNPVDNPQIFWDDAVVAAAFGKAVEHLGEFVSIDPKRLGEVLESLGVEPTVEHRTTLANALIRGAEQAKRLWDRRLPPPPLPPRPGPRAGAAGRFDAHLDGWLSTLSVELKTKAMARAAIIRFAEQFPHVADVTAEKVQDHVNRLSRQGAAVATIRRTIGELRSYWRYMTSLGLAPKDTRPFDGLTLPRAPKKANGEDARKPFEPGDVVRLLEAARAKGDGQLADLIKLAMYSGARREELCALKCDAVDFKGRSFKIADAKTAAGVREVPIHSALVTTLRRLAIDSRDGYVLPLTATKYGDRGDAIGKRFGKLKTSMGFGPDYVFHSIRKTVTTLLEKAGVSENVAADILGHEKPRITYGLYSGGSSMVQKREAIERIAYPDAI